MRFLKCAQVMLSDGQVAYLSEPSARTFALAYKASSALIGLTGRPAADVPLDQQIDASAVIVASCLWKDEAMTARIFASADEAAEGMKSEELCALAAAALGMSAPTAEDEKLGARFPDSAGTS